MRTVHRHAVREGEAEGLSLLFPLRGEEMYLFSSK